MNSKSIYPRLDDVIQRRIRTAPEPLLQEAISTNRHAAHFWVENDFCILALGTNNFISKARKNNLAFGKPFPRIIEAGDEADELACLGMAGKYQYVNNVSMKNYPLAIRVYKGASVRVSKSTIETDKFGSQFINLILAERFTEAVDAFQFSETVEILLAAMFDPMIEVAFHAA